MASASGQDVVAILDQRQAEIDSGEVTSLGHQYLPETLVTFAPKNTAVYGVQNLKVAETGGAVWEGSVVCAQYFAMHPDLLQGRPKIIELGAGTGFCAAALAVLMKEQQQDGCEQQAGVHICATDDPANVELMASTLTRNRATDIATAEAYRWGQEIQEDSQLNKLKPFDIICGTDLLYNPDSMEELLKALLDLSGLETQIFLCWKTRFAFVEESFIDKLAPSHFTVEKVFEAAPRCFDKGHAMKMFRLTRRT